MMENKVNVLSLFDGMSVCRVALERIGYSIDKYYSSEIDKYAIQISQKNYPDNIQLGSVTDWEEWDVDWSSIDLVTGGFPCQSWSTAGKQLGDKDPRGMLFWTMLDIIKKVLDNNPNAKFLMENVKMKKEFEEYITYHTEQSLGSVNKILINSALVSAQNRQRYYWTNIDGVDQPEDKGIVLRDIIQDDIDESFYLTEKAIDYMSRLRNGKPRWEYHKNPVEGKAACLTANMYKGVPYGVVGRPCEVREYNDNSVCHHIADATDINGNDSIKRVYAETGKAPTLTTMQGGHREPKILIVPEATKKGYVEVYPGDCVDLTFINSKTRRGRLMRDKSNCLTAANYDYSTWNGYRYRKLTPIECERLQTLPDNYTEGVSNSQRYKMLGNGWTVDVIAHIFKKIKE